MSYSRWGRDSVWYAFYAGGGTLALWSAVIKDWEFRDLFLITAKRIKKLYKESDKDCAEAIDYVQEFQLDWIMERLGSPWQERGKIYNLPVAIAGTAYLELHSYLLTLRL